MSIPQPYKEVIDRVMSDVNAKLERLRSINTSEVKWDPVLIRSETDIAAIDPLIWLQEQKNPTKIYWQDRDRKLTIAGVGCANCLSVDSAAQYHHIFTRIKARKRNTQDPHIKYFGGFSFPAPQRELSGYSPPWPSSTFILPQIEIIIDNAKGCKLAVNLFLEGSKNIITIEAQLKQLLAGLIFTPDSLSIPKQHDQASAPQILHRVLDSPDRHTWEKWLQTVLNAIKNKKLEKIVLARHTQFSSPKSLDPFRLLQCIGSKDNNCFHFGFQLPSGIAFIGASPERLYKRQGRNVWVEAVAGTRERGDNQLRDNQLGEQLIQSPKESHEHRFVVEDLIRGLHSFQCTPLHQEPLAVLKLPEIQHLIMRMQTELPESVTDEQLLATLHPTSAVGGYPLESALHTMAALEPFERKWYAGAVGWISDDAAEFVVAIRSAYVSQTAVHAYTGAGIVADSTPEAEWQELEKKLHSFIGRLMSTP